jgi:hypothetical protein
VGASYRNPIPLAIQTGWLGDRNRAAGDGEHQPTRRSPAIPWRSPGSWWPQSIGCSRHTNPKKRIPLTPRDWACRLLGRASHTSGARSDYCPWKRRSTSMIGADGDADLVAQHAPERERAPQALRTAIFRSPTRARCRARRARPTSSALARYGRPGVVVPGLRPIGSRIPAADSLAADHLDRTGRSQSGCDWPLVTAGVRYERRPCALANVRAAPGRSAFPTHRSLFGESPPVARRAIRPHRGTFL